MDSLNQLHALLQSLMKKGHDALEMDVTPESVKSATQKLVKPVRSIPSIELPFQAYVYTFQATENESWSSDVAHLPEVLDEVQIYRYGDLTELKAVFMATHEAIAHPFTVEALWTTQNVVATGKDFPKSFGSQMFVIGGVNSGNSHPTMDADLKSLNPAIKSSVTFKDTPRFCMRVRPNREAVKEVEEGAKQMVHGYLLLCGKIRVSSPGFAHCNFAEDE